LRSWSRTSMPLHSEQEQPASAGLKRGESQVILV
jgi:hypothetical protein